MIVQPGREPTAVQSGREPTGLRAEARANLEDSLVIWHTIVDGVQRLAAARIGFVLAALGLYIVSLFLVGYRWRGFLRMVGGKSGVVRATLATLAGISVNNLTPSSRVGGEACRVTLVRMAGEASWRQATIAAVWDRLSAVPALAVLALLGALAARDVISGWHPHAVAALGAAAIALLALAVLSVRRWLPGGGRWREYLALDRVKGRTVVAGIGWSVLIWLQDVVRVMCAANAFGVELSPTRAAMLSTVTVLGGLAPTVGGLGVVEGGLMAGLLAMRIDPPTAVAITTVERGVSYGFGTAAGAVTLALTGGRRLWTAARARRNVRSHLLEPDPPVHGVPDQTS